MKILFILKNRIYNETYAVSYGLSNSANQVANFLTNQKTYKHKNYETKVVSVVDANGIDKEIYNYKPNVVIIEALWCPAYKLKELIELNRYKHIKWIVRIHSDAGFLTAENLALQYVNEYINLNKSNLFIALNNKDFYLKLKNIYAYHFVYLPNVVEIKKFKRKYNHHRKNEIHIGCFGALRILKNQFFQGICAIEAANKLNKKLYFHINDNVSNTSNPVLKNLENLFINTEHELVKHKWMTHENFEHLIFDMDLGLQISYTESFNIVTADFINMSTPIICSEAISWIPWFYKTSTVNYNDVISKIIQIYKLRNVNCFMKHTNKKLKKYVNESKLIWLKFLNT